MSTRLCLSFERTPQWFKNNKLLFHFDKSTCRIVGDLEYLIRRKFAITSVCHLYLDGYLLPSQESIDLVRDGDNLRVENESLYHSIDDNNENGIFHNTDTDKSHSIPKKRKHSENTKLPVSKYPRSSSGKDKSAESATESSKSGYKKNDDECRLTSASQKSDLSSCTGNTTKSFRSTSSHTKKSSKKQKIERDINSSDTKNSSATQKHKKKKAVASVKENTPSSSESSNSDSSSSESSESSSTEPSFETESSPTDSSFTEELSTEESSDTETSSTELPSSKSLPPSFPSETSTFESGHEPANSKQYTKKHSSDTSQSSLCSSALASKPNSGKRSSKRTIEKNNKEISNPSQSSSDQSKETRVTSKSSATSKQSLAQSNKKSLSISVANTGCLSSIAEESLNSMPSSKESVNQSSATGVPTRNGALPSRISNAKHIHFDSDDDELKILQETFVNVDVNGSTLNQSSMSNHHNGIGIVTNRVGNNMEEETGRNTSTHLLIACDGSIGDDGKYLEREKVLDFSVLPPLCGPPRVGDRIAYKILEMSASYTPEMSAYKEGIVLAYDPKNGEVLVELTPESLVKPLGDGNISNKFELMSDDDDVNDVSSKPLPVFERKVAVLWSSMVSPKLINS